jgi:hypothetical protein
MYTMNAAERLALYCNILNYSHARAAMQQSHLHIFAYVELSDIKKSLYSIGEVLGGSRGCRGTHPLSGRKNAIFNVCPLVARNTYKKALVHCTKPTIFSRKRKCFFATRKDVEYYSQMPGKRILALEFSNFSGGAPPPGPHDQMT